MSLVPRQPQADEEVIAYYSKKPKLNYREIAALAAGINPLALDAAGFADEHHPYITEKRPLLDDILQRLDDYLDQETLFAPKPASEWRAIFEELNLPFPAELKSPETPIAANADEERPQNMDRELGTKRSNTLYTMIGVLALEHGIDLTQPGPAREKFEELSEKHGIKPLSRNTIEGVFENVRVVIDHRRE